MFVSMDQRAQAKPKPTQSNDEQRDLYECQYQMKTAKRTCYYYTKLGRPFDSRRSWVLMVAWRDCKQEIWRVTGSD